MTVGVAIAKHVFPSRKGIEELVKEILSRDLKMPVASAPLPGYKLIFRDDIGLIIAFIDFHGRAGQVGQRRCRHALEKLHRFGQPGIVVGIFHATKKLVVNVAGGVVELLENTALGVDRRGEKFQPVVHFGTGRCVSSYGIVTGESRRPMAEALGTKSIHGAMPPPKVAARCGQACGHAEWPEQTIFVEPHQNCMGLFKLRLMQAGREMDISVGELVQRIAVLKGTCRQSCGRGAPSAAASDERRSACANLDKFAACDCVRIHF